jgi:hypothetical protein
MNDWRLKEAKKNFSEVMTKALTLGPQRVRWRDQSVIVLAEADYQRLITTNVSLKDYLLNGREISNLELVRDKAPMPEVAW